MTAKRLGRYHYHQSVKDNNPINYTNGNPSSSVPPLNGLASFYEEKSVKSLLDWDKPLIGRQGGSLQKLFANANRTTKRASQFISKIKSRQLACASRIKSIPKNATIRKEYIKCGKQMCLIEHGPYYYAYWKDPQSKKLKKKYIGGHMPESKTSRDESTNNLLL